MKAWEGSSADSLLRALPNESLSIIQHLLQSSQYEQAASHIEQALLEAAKLNNHLLAAYLQEGLALCLAYRQAQKDVLSRQWATHLVQQRANQLEDSLISKFINLDGGVAPPQLIEGSRKPTDAGIFSKTNLARWWRLLTEKLHPNRGSKAVAPKTRSISSLAVTQALPFQPNTLSAQLPIQSNIAIPSSKQQQKNDSPKLIAFCLGTFRVTVDSQPIDLPQSRKGSSIFKFLIINHQRPTHREVLMDTFWPEIEPDSARNNLNVAIYSLRQALRKANPNMSTIIHNSGHYQLNPEFEIWVDVDEFETLTQQAMKAKNHNQLEERIRHLLAAESLYHGDFMAEDRYDDWLQSRRSELQMAYVGLLDNLSNHYFESEDYAACIMFCQKLLAIEPCSEQTHRRLMRSYCRQRLQHLALRQFHQCTDLLKKELDLFPSEETNRLYDCIRQHIPV